MKYIFLFFVALNASASSPSVVPSSSSVKWRTWNENIFRDAKAEGKLVLIDLEAVWCHWCHVMDQKTYSDLVVSNALNEGYVAVKVDQEAFPDLGKRYEDYGWPATVFLNGEGQELKIRSGYIAAQEMAEILAQLRKNPKPLAPDAPSKVVALSGLEKILRQQIKSRYDQKVAGWKGGHKYLDRFFIEDQITLALNGDVDAGARAVATLNAARKLVDPVWGGVYQYSVDGNWNEPHFEKIMSYQADYIHAYTFAYLAWKNPRDLETAKSIASYLKEFMTSPEGAFYTSQDADLVQGEHGADYYSLNREARKKKGLPKVDQHIYTRENGWAVDALVSLYQASRDEVYLRQAEKAMRWILAHRLQGTGFRHGEESVSQFYLGDQVAAGKALLSLYIATGNREWLKTSEATIKFIDKEFGEKSGGYRTAHVGLKGSPLVPKATPDENIALGRYAALMSHVSEESDGKKIAQNTLQYLLSSSASETIYLICGMLLLKSEIENDPLHITVIGKADAPATVALVREALAYPALGKNIERMDPSGLNPDFSKVPYPKMNKPAAFVCTGVRCSFPLTETATFQQRVDQILGRK